MRNSPDDYAIRGSTPTGVGCEGTCGGCLFHAKVFADTSKKNKLTVSTLFFIQILTAKRGDGEAQNTKKIMKKVILSVMFIAATLGLTSCGSVGMVGSVYTGNTEPKAVTSNAIGSKVGMAQCTSVLGLIAIGDGGINAAAKEGGIKKVSHVDVKTLSVLGLFTVQKYFVYGE